MTAASTDHLLQPAFRRRSWSASALLRRVLDRLGAAEDRRQLHDLSEHMLQDLGLLRDQIDDALRAANRRRADHLRTLGG